jgi:hypothetical protein
MRHKRIGTLACAVLAAIAWCAPARAAGAVHDYTGVVPVLVYHGIHLVEDPVQDPYSIPPSEFARQMAMLVADGFHTISITQYAQFQAGGLGQLPDRPILITFDDGRIDSYGAADPILARYGMRAAMFVITANADAAKPGYLGWRALARMAGSGRWEVQEHAHTGHVVIPTGPAGATGPYYANLLYRNGARETFTNFKRRVTSDVLTGRRLMASHVPGFQSLVFAVPYGNYGQVRTNYAPIPAWERGWLTRTFAGIFVQDHPAYNRPGNPVGQRYAIHARTTASSLEAWLARALPRNAWIVPPSKPAPISKHRRPKRPSLRRLRVGRHRVVMILKGPPHAKLEVTRRRSGHVHRARVRVRRGGRVRDRGLHAATTYIYRAVAIARSGRRSRVLRVRIHTRR